MKRSLLLTLTALVATLTSWANNTSTTVEQVTTPVELSTDVDYHITSTTPFGAMGSIDITNTDHAVIIFDNLKPSQALKFLSFVKINGEAAVSETNCQVRLYNRGAILFPYGKESSAATGFHPLVVYDGQNCTGTSCDLFGLESSGGFMNTLSAAKLNNKIRSFTLKRGYMVTFSLRSGGYGYSRCFIADQADLVVNSLPSLMDGRISSYRVFRWYNTSKLGLANDTGAGICDALNVTSCYSFSAGESRLPDQECVPHHIYEDWPSAAACGSVTYSCHMKTNNEPGNSADDHPQTVDQILANWENLMRTGMRLCSPSSHDGSLNHLRQFMDSIDARGWRCDIIDLHCYWADGSFNDWAFNTQWADKYGRPIWISEWVWGASWNSNGAFASGVTEEQNRNMLRDKLLPYLNQTKSIERYYYWNSERDPSRIYKNGALTPAGEVYAAQNTGLGYSNYKNYVPKTPRFYAVSDFNVDYTARSGACKFTWTNRNCDLTDVTILQKKTNTGWVSTDTMTYSEASSRTFSTTLSRSDNIGLNEFRLMCIDADGRARTSNTASVFIGGATNLGDIMVGSIEANSVEASSIYFATQEKAPVVITGIPTNKNSGNGIVNHVSTIAKDNFKFNFDPWTEGTTLNFKYTESTDYIVIHPGNYQWGDLRAEVDTCEYLTANGTKSVMSQGDTIQVTFNEPFDEGVIPVVLLQNVTSESGLPTTPRLLEVTNTGFKMKLTYQTAITKKPRQQYTFYIAITPGSALLGDTGMRIHAGRCTELTGGAGAIANYFRTEAGDTLYFNSPRIIADTQTNNFDYPSVFRKSYDITKNITGDDGEERTVVCGIRVLRQMDSTASIASGSNTAAKCGDHLGWLVIDTDPTKVGITSPASPQTPLYVEIQGRAILPSDPAARIFNLGGLQVKAGTQLMPGVYVVSNGKTSVKVLVK